MSEKFITDWFYVAIDSEEEERNSSGFLGLFPTTRTVTTHQPRRPDIDNFASNIAILYNKYDAQGYDVVNIIPINGGSQDSVHSRLNSGQTSYVGEISFSTTRGAIVVGRKRD